LSEYKRISYSVRNLLIGFGIAVAAPLVILLAVLLYRSAHSERSELELRLLQVASNLAALIDRDIDRSVALLETLATSPAVTTEDWPRFYRQAKAALGGRGYLVFVDRAGRQIVNTYVPYGDEPRFTGDPETVRRMLASKAPVVSDLFMSLVVKELVYNISIPVLTDGEVRYVMSLGLKPKDLAETLRSLKLNSSWVTTIWDRNNVILARSRDHDRFLGTTLPNTLREQRDGLQALLKITNLDNENVLLALAASKLSDWGISVSVPVAIAEAPLRSSLWLWGGTALGVMTVAVALGLLVGRLLASSLENLAVAARGPPNETSIPSLTRVREVNDVARTLQQARENQVVLVREVTHRVKNILAVVQALVTRSMNDDQSVAQSREVVIQRLQALARAHDALIGGNWSGVPLADIVNGELAPFSDRVSVQGPLIVVDPDAVQPLTLVLHELTTNAIKHGALLIPTGTISVSWQIEPSGEERLLTFEWREKNGPKVVEPLKIGLGTRLLRGVVTTAKAELFYEPMGFFYRLQLPLGRAGSH
jgi:two-component sensor histidine kinase